MRWVIGDYRINIWHDLDDRIQVGSPCSISGERHVAEVKVIVSFSFLLTLHPVLYFVSLCSENVKETVQNHKGYITEGPWEMKAIFPL